MHPDLGLLVGSCCSMNTSTRLAPTRHVCSVHGCTAACVVHGAVRRRRPLSSLSDGIGIPWAVVMVYVQLRLLDVGITTLLACLNTGTSHTSCVLCSCWWAWIVWVPGALFSDNDATLQDKQWLFAACYLLHAAVCV